MKNNSRSPRIGHAGEEFAIIQGHRKPTVSYATKEAQELTVSYATKEAQEPTVSYATKEAQEPTVSYATKEAQANSLCYKKLSKL